MCNSSWQSLSSDIVLCVDSVALYSVKDGYRHIRMKNK